MCGATSANSHKRKLRKPSFAVELIKTALRGWKFDQLPGQVISEDIRPFQRQLPFIRGGFAGKLNKPHRPPRIDAVVLQVVQDGLWVEVPGQLEQRLEGNFGRCELLEVDVRICAAYIFNVVGLWVVSCVSIVQC